MNRSDEERGGRSPVSLRARLSGLRFSLRRQSRGGALEPKR